MSHRTAKKRFCWSTSTLHRLDEAVVVKQGLGRLIELEWSVCEPPIGFEMLALDWESSRPKEICGAESPRIPGPRSKAQALTEIEWEFTGPNFG